MLSLTLKEGVHGAGSLQFQFAMLVGNTVVPDLVIAAVQPSAERLISNSTPAASRSRSEDQPYAPALSVAQAPRE